MSLNVTEEKIEIFFEELLTNPDVREEITHLRACYPFNSKRSEIDWSALKECMINSVHIAMFKDV